MMEKSPPISVYSDIRMTLETKVQQITKKLDVAYKSLQGQRISLKIEKIQNQIFEGQNEILEVKEIINHFFNTYELRKSILLKLKEENVGLKENILELKKEVWKFEKEKDGVSGVVHEVENLKKKLCERDEEIKSYNECLEVVRSNLRKLRKWTKRRFEKLYFFTKKLKESQFSDESYSDLLTRILKYKKRNPFKEVENFEIGEKHHQSDSKGTSTPFSRYSTFSSTKENINKEFFSQRNNFFEKKNAKDTTNKSLGKSNYSKSVISKSLSILEKVKRNCREFRNDTSRSFKRNDIKLTDLLQKTPKNNENRISIEINGVDGEEFKGLDSELLDFTRLTPRKISEKKNLRSQKVTNDNTSSVFNPRNTQKRKKKSGTPKKKSSSKKRKKSKFRVKRQVKAPKKPNSSNIASYFAKKRKNSKSKGKKRRKSTQRNNCNTSLNNSTKISTRKNRAFLLMENIFKNKKLNFEAKEALKSTKNGRMGIKRGIVGYAISPGIAVRRKIKESFFLKGNCSDGNILIRSREADRSCERFKMTGLGNFEARKRQGEADDLSSFGLKKRKSRGRKRKKRGSCLEGGIMKQKKRRGSQKGVLG